MSGAIDLLVGIGKGLVEKLADSAGDALSSALKQEITDYVRPVLNVGQGAITATSSVDVVEQTLEAYEAASQSLENYAVLTGVSPKNIDLSATDLPPALKQVAPQALQLQTVVGKDLIPMVNEDLDDHDHMIEDIHVLEGNEVASGDFIEAQAKFCSNHFSAISNVLAHSHLFPAPSPTQSIGALMRMHGLEPKIRIAGNQVAAGSIFGVVDVLAGSEAWVTISFINSISLVDASYGTTITQTAFDAGTVRLEVVRAGTVLSSDSITLTTIQNYAFSPIYVPQGTRLLIKYTPAGTSVFGFEFTARIHGIAFGSTVTDLILAGDKRLIRVLERKMLHYEAAIKTWIEKHLGVLQMYLSVMPTIEQLACDTSSYVNMQPALVTALSNSYNRRRLLTYVAGLADIPN